MSVNLTHTGVQEIDAILDAVESAASCYHNTEQWGDDSDGESYVDVISRKAAEAAAVLQKK
jgi:hypothetical protein